MTAATRARQVWAMGDWCRRYRAAKAAGNLEAMDLLDDELLEMGGRGCE